MQKIEEFYVKEGIIHGVYIPCWDMNYGTLV